MNGPKSSYLKKIIKKKSFSNVTNREYVLDLFNIEKYITDGVKCYSSGILFSQLQSKYQKEYLAIKIELDPKGYLIESEEQDKMDERRENNLRLDKLDNEKKLMELKDMWDKVKSEKN